MRTVLTAIVQTLALLVISKAGYVVVDVLRLPLPGNVLGMLVLLALLASGVVPLRWIDSSASLLVRHLAFFFIPITVGLMGFTDLFAANGPAIALTLIVSAGVGICGAGLSSQALASRMTRRPS